ncbi:MAG: methionine--tRNA ligase [Planctomycetota bacterium]|nr:methionine--tRNA ligase [Planctomycetota bacterium]
MSRYITTPIYYVNDRPHIGHVYTTTLCDVYSRAMRQHGDVFFLTGTDEHGIKVEQSAKERGLSPQALADENAAEFQSVMNTFNLSNDEFIRTTDPEHMSQVQSFVSTLLDQGDIYLGTFEGWYDEGQEEYHTETSAKEHKYISPISGKPLVRASEKNYYFKLSAYQEKIEDLFKAQPSFVMPESRRNEVLGRLKEGLQDVPISRTNFTWGIPMPDDPNHVIYVWIDALFNYITALGLGNQESDRFKARGHYWPATYHVVGKEILWFHAVIWPAILMALNLKLPACIYAHSFWISGGKKMSKSLGNFVDLQMIESIVDKYGMDAWRYFIVTQGPLGATDADFTEERFHEIYNAHLVNTVGNCCSRVTAMIEKYLDGDVPRCKYPIRESPNAPASTKLCNQSNSAVDAWLPHMKKFEIAQASELAMGLIRDVDVFINDTEPFILAKDENKREELKSILYQCLETLRIASNLLLPLMPERMSTFLGAIYPQDPQDPTHEIAVKTSLNMPGWGECYLGKTQSLTKIALFPRID